MHRPHRHIAGHRTDLTEPRPRDGGREASRETRAGLGHWPFRFRLSALPFRTAGISIWALFAGERNEKVADGRRWRRTSGLRDSREYGFIYTVHSSVIFSRSKHNGRTTGGQPVQYGCLLRSMPIIHRVLNTGPSICKVKDWPIGSGPVGSAAMKQTIVEKDG